ncbi:hypothetical protein BDZ88DRAFT_187124 [Geranomyces variabilis]|nr:hypothetical protein BDZ88DRAFT_187124 [Geranomyces variabilis]
MTLQVTAVRFLAFFLAHFEALILFFLLSDFAYTRLIPLLLSLRRFGFCCLTLSSLLLDAFAVVFLFSVYLFPCAIQNYIKAAKSWKFLFHVESLALKRSESYQIVGVSHTFFFGLAESYCTL